MYKSPDDPQIEADMAAIELEAKNFREKYHGKEAEFLKDENSFFEALTDFEKVSALTEEDKPGTYLLLLSDIHLQDRKIKTCLARLEKRMTQVGVAIEFFELSLGKINPERQEFFLQSETLSSYRYFLQFTFNASRYDLSEKEEKLMSLTEGSSCSDWIRTGEELRDALTVKYNGKEIPLSEASEMQSSLPRQQRKKIHAQIIKKLKSIRVYSAAEMNAIVNYNKISDDVRGFSHSFSETLLDHEIEEETFPNLVSTTKSLFPISHRFFQLHAKLLNQKKLSIFDSNVPLKPLTFDFDIHVVPLVRKAFSLFHPSFSDIFESYLLQGQIDLYPRKGKISGSYCLDQPGGIVYLLFNYVKDMNSLIFFAHEIGHAIHAELSKHQGIFYLDVPIPTAETASTFSECLVFDELLRFLPEDQKITVLHFQLMNDVFNTFAQIAWVNFEIELHERIRKDGSMSDVEMARLAQKHMSSYRGSVVDVTEDDGYSFIDHNHIRNFFYQYSYAYGGIVSKAMFAKWKQDPTFSEKIIDFNRARGSDSPYNIFKQIGIDTKDPEFFKSGLMEISKSIDELEALARKAGKLK